MIVTMQRLVFTFVMGILALGLVGCEDRQGLPPGPTVKKFDGKVVADGKPIPFGADDTISLRLVHSSAQSFGIPIKADGTFSIGEMPVGKYSATLEIQKVAENPKGGKGPSGQPIKINVSGGFEIKEGQSEYTVDMGKNFKY
jgi:hypothetical protein